MPIFVTASNQIGLDTRSMTRGSIKVGIRGGGQASAEDRVLVIMMHCGVWGWRSRAKDKAVLPFDIWLHILVILFYPHVG